MGSFFTSTQIYNPNLLDREQFINFFCEEMKKNIQFLLQNDTWAEQNSLGSFLICGLVCLALTVVQKYEHITELTPEIMHELIEKIVVYAPEKSDGHRTQQIEIHFRFDVAVATAIADSREYDKKKKAA